MFNIFQTTLLLAYPVIFSHMIEFLVPFLNTYLSAQISNNALAASALTHSTFISLMGFCWGVVTAVGIATSQKIGKKQYNQTAIILKSGLIIGIVLSIITMIIFKNFSVIWLFFKQDPQVVKLAQLYLDGWLWGAIPDCLKYACFQFCISFNKTKVFIITHLIIIPAIYLLNLTLIWGGYGLEAHGIYGIGLGTSIVYWLAFLFFIVYMFFDKDMGPYLKVRNKFIDFKDEIIYQIKLGVPIGFMFVIEIFFFLIFAIILGYIDEMALASYQILNQWLILFIMIPYGLTETAIILVGKAYGQGNMALAQKYSSACSIISMIKIIFIAILFWFYAKYFISFDIDINDPQNKDIFLIAELFFKFAAVTIIIDSIRLVTSGVLRGLNYTQFPMWTSLICFWFIGIPLCYYLAITLSLKYLGMWVGFIIILLISAIIQYIKLYKIFKTN